MKRIFAIMACSLTLSAHASCYMVYKADHVIYQSGDAPVDTRYQYHETVPRRFGQGASLVYVSGGEECLTVSTPLNVPRSYANTASMRGGNEGRPRKADRG